MFDILETVENWLAQGREVALATVVETWGSSPRAPGAKMGISDQMTMIGSVSGGCVETAVVQEALDSLKDRRPRLLHYGVSDDTAWDVGLACGGKMAVYVEPLDLPWWRVMCEAVRQDQQVVTVTVIQGAQAGQKVAIGAAGVLYRSDHINPELDTQLAQLAEGGINHGSTGLVEVEGVTTLVDSHKPRPRLVIIGGAHVAMALHNMARELGFRVTLIDPRQAFATTDRFPYAESISHSYPDKALTQFTITPETYFAILTHDPKIDDPAIRFALSSPAAYIGVLSSERTHEKRKQRLIEAGTEPSLLDRIHTPIGLNIGAKTPEEIAIAILAEIIAVRNGSAK